MLTKWKVANFKCVTNEVSLEIAPLTIFAGPNSSGKSTVIQTILLIAQTLLHKIGSRSVVLNGVLTRLGQFDDLRTFNSNFKDIRIGWECEPPSSVQSFSKRSARLASPSTRMSDYKSIACDIAFDAHPKAKQREIFQLQPRLTLASISCQLAQEANLIPKSTLTVPKTNPYVQIKRRDRHSAGSTSEFILQIDNQTLNEIRRDLITAKPFDCQTNHFLPDRPSFQIDTAKEIANYLCIVLGASTYRNEMFRRVIPDAPFLSNETVIPISVIEILKNELGGHVKSYFELMDRTIDTNEPSDNGQVTFRDLVDFLRSQPPRIRNEIRERTEKARQDDLQGKILKVLYESDLNKKEVVEDTWPARLRRPLYYLTDYFTNCIKYLGPLRDEPKPMYPIATTTLYPSDVGLHGEYAAAVLDLYKNESIRYVQSDTFRPDVKCDSLFIQSTLKSAIEDWLEYLSVAQSVQTQDKGKFGTELKVESMGESGYHDLTHVGVGVSQVMPILVLCLLAKPDETLIFEQPELHLHPMVQSRLADFFLSMTLLGKQCILETHSEYIINRLRLRAATAVVGTPIHNKIKIYFVSKHGNQSEFTPVSINEYGAILDWPKGFFDQSQHESEEILRAAIDKNRKERAERNK